jgi:membrane fusion protein (multidrug efflux system)
MFLRTSYSITLLIALLFPLVGCKGGSDQTKLALPTAQTAQASAPLSSISTEANSETPEIAKQPESSTGSASQTGTVRVTGSTSPRRSSAVAVNGSGLLQQMLVKEGDFVQAGQTIARLDRSDSELRVRQAQVGLDGARVSLKAAQRERNRLARLDQGSAVSQAQIDGAQTALDGAQVGVAAAEVALAMAEDANRNRSVRAPFAGLVVARLKAEGEWITTMPPSPVIQLVEIDPLDLQIDAPESLLTRIRLGDRVVARFASIGRTVETKVSRIVPMVQTGNRSFKVFADIPNKDHSIQPGVFAEIEITASAEPPARNTGSKKVRKARTAQ